VKRREYRLGLLALGLVQPLETHISAPNHT